jgi:L-ascorbate metabolism protein UlaG (beta-lactamase superfamily)
MSKKKMILSVIFGLVGAVLLFIIVYANTSPQIGGKSLKYDSPNFKEGKFKNLIPTPMLTEGNSLIKVTFDSFFSKSKEAYPNMSLPTSKINDYLIKNTEDITVTWLGHSTTLITSKGLVILTDPVLNNKRLPPLHLGPRPFAYTINYGVKDLPNVDIVLISHDHYDHLDMETIKKLSDSMFFVPLGVKSHLVKWGVDEKNICELDWYDKKSFSDIDLIFAPARHFGGRGLFNRDKTLWGSWIIKLKNKTLYFGGDSGYFNEFKKIGKEYGPFDLVMLDTGQYNEAWPLAHMFPEEVIQASVDLNAKAILPIHNSKYVLAMHSWYEPFDRLIKAAAKGEIKIMTPRIGETVKVSGFKNSYWWRDVK